ncbi:hypothetical protein ACFVGN_11785 [Streptomyces sp. NPDC057757]|uniref:hypothetical protein n=1 Tax=Streptomyces sp. NPDC057757 TaxID=3346241 RepID=UPI0036B92CE3
MGTGDTGTGFAATGVVTGVGLDVGTGVGTADVEAADAGAADVEAADVEATHVDAADVDAVTAGCGMCSGRAPWPCRLSPPGCSRVVRPRSDMRPSLSE